MQTSELTWIQDHRRLIHDLVIQRRATGLSPPEEELLEGLEAEELHDVRGDVIAPDSFFYEKREDVFSLPVSKYVSKNNKETKSMNNLEFSATIIKMKNYQTNLSIICQNNPFSGKTARFSVNVTGDNKKEWENKLKEGDLITVSGDIAEAKQNNYGAYIAIWNPIIHEAKRIKSEMIDISDYDEESENQSCEGL